MALATGSRHRWALATAVGVAALGVAVALLWQRPGAELVLFHAAWIGLALLAVRVASQRLRVPVVMCLVVAAMAIVIEVDDLRTHHQVADSLVELSLDLPAFVALVVLARRQGRALADEQRRRERQRAFFANAAHALRTPITIARGHTELAMQSASDPDVKADLMVALDELDRLTRAAERNLRLSVVGEVDQQSFRPIDAGALVLATIERWKPTAPRSWSAEALGEAGVVLADSEQLTEALDALIENAVSATASGGSIVARSEVQGDAVVLSVIDDGCGVAMADPEQLFEPFERGPLRPTRTSSGTGLGLAVVRAIAVAHGGRAEMESSPGAGTTVRIVLPRCSDRRPHAPDGPAPVVTA